MIDILDIIERIEELEVGLAPLAKGDDKESERELANLMVLMESLEWDRGEVEWRGNWYPQMVEPRAFGEVAWTT